MRWSKIVDRLLASPHYGERWGRHWLDLVRYADSGGFERDLDWPNAWRYRDYVVERVQSATSPTTSSSASSSPATRSAPGSDEAHIATGYLRLGPDNNIKTERTAWMSWTTSWRPRR